MLDSNKNFRESNKTKKGVTSPNKVIPKIKIKIVTIHMKSHKKVTLTNL